TKPLLATAFLKYVGLQWGAVVPLTLPLAIVAIGRAARSAVAGERLLFWCFCPMMAFFAAVSWKIPTHVLWPLPCWLGVMVLMAGATTQGIGRIAEFYRRSAPWIAAGMATLFLGASLHLAVQLPGLPQPSPMHGWSEVARRTSELRNDLPPDSFILGI